MTPDRFTALTTAFHRLRVGIVGDFSLDRYFDIDPARAEVSIETGLPVHQIIRVRCQPGAAGNITQNLAALAPAVLWPIGECGDDGEGFELRRSLQRLANLRLDHFQTRADRLTFTYTKPLLHHSGRPPEELSRLDLKSSAPMAPKLEQTLAASLHLLAPQLDVLIVMDQAGIRGCGVISAGILAALAEISRTHPRLILMADSRHGLGGFPPLAFKMNAVEFAVLTGRPAETINAITARATELARRNGQPVFVTLAERGMVGAAPDGTVEHVPVLPLRGAIDIVGAGDTVTAMLSLALAAGATLREAMELAQAAASVVVHQLGTTGVATAADLRSRLFP